MTSSNDLRQQLLNPALSTDERAQLRCQLAKQLQESGDYQAAAEAMGELWLGLGEPPNLQNLHQSTRAEVLLRAGALTGWLGGGMLNAASQETAKDMINESIRIFKSLKNFRKVAEAETEIAFCYWREDAPEDARVMLAKARSRLDDRDGDLKAVTVLRCVALDKLTHRPHEALSTLMKAESLFEASEDETLKGKFHYELANVLENLGLSEERVDYTDRALDEYFTASFYFQKTGDAYEQACVETNLAETFLKAKRVKEAREHLDRAQSLFTLPAHHDEIAKLKTIRAGVLLAEGNYVEAEKIAGEAVQMLEQSLPPEFLATDTTAFPTVDDEAQTHAALENEFYLNDERGYMDIPPFTSLSHFEELAKNLSEEEVNEFFQITKDLVKTRDDRTEFEHSIIRAHHFLITHGFGLIDWTTFSLQEELHKQKEQHIRMALEKAADKDSKDDWPSFSLDGALHSCETHYLRRALKDAGGVLELAAYFLALRPQQLRYMLKNHHKSLRHLVSTGPEISPDGDAPWEQDEVASHEAEAIMILHFVKDKTMAAMVQEVVEREGWKLVRCFMEPTAVKKLVGTDNDFDLLLVDCETSRRKGLRLIATVRDFFHRRHMPIVVLSGTLDEAAARKAGADVFLHKPQDIPLLVPTITNLFTF